MKIKYIVNLRIPTEKAHGYQIAKMCAELARAGHEVELIAPTRVNLIKEDVFTYYGLQNKFRITYIKSYDWLIFTKSLGKLSFYLQSAWFFLKLVFLKFDKAVVILTRNPEIAWLFAQKSDRVYFEAHNWPQSKTGLFKYLLQKCCGIICNSKGTESAFIENGFNNTLAAPNGVDLNEFNIDESEEQSRLKLGLPAGKKIIMYIGHLYEWKGADTIMEAAPALMAEDDILIVLVGGTEGDIKKYKEKIANNKLNNITIVGHQPHDKMPSYLLTADILLLPNKPITKESELYTSPIKMFEYMAAGRPIIASDLPSIRAILDENSAIFFKAGDASDLAAKIRWAADNSNEIQKKAAGAKDKVREYSWESRARKILDFVRAADQG